MKNVYKLFLLLIVLFKANDSLGVELGQKASVNLLINSIDKFIPFPEDTTVKFIQKYGKDSLIHLIDSRIEEAKGFIGNQTMEFDNLEFFTDFFYLNTKFNWGFDTSDFPYYQKIENYKSLYNLVDFDKQFFLDTIKKLGSDKVNNILLEDLKKGGAAHTFMLPLFCDMFDVKSNLIDLIIQKNVYISFNDLKKEDVLFKQIANYIEFGKINQKCRKKYPQIMSIQDTLFDNLYSSNSILRVLSDSSIVDPNRMEDVNYFASLNILAYALYFDDINLKTHGDNLMYLIHTQQTAKDGGWRFAHYLDKESNVYLTMYGLWSLCQFKELVSNLK
jgi:hypothetical protein